MPVIAEDSCQNHHAVIYEIIPVISRPEEGSRQPHQRRGAFLLAVVDGLIVADVILDADDLFPTIQWHGSMHRTLLITQFITEWSFGFYK